MIELAGLRKEFAGTVALDGIDLSVPAGQIHGIVGRSGAGKSTLIRCLTGLERPSSGSAVIDGIDITAQRGAALRRARRSIGMVFQHANLLDSLTAAGNVAHPLKVAGVGRAERRRRAAELLDLVGLGDRADNHPAQLSGGQQQRVGIARALAAQPRILLCDEPTSALDSATTAQILSLIASLRESLGITVLIITHEMSVVREACDAVTLLADGRVASTGSLRRVLGEPGTALARDLLPLPEGREDSAAEVRASGRASVQVALAGTSVPELFALAETAGAPIAGVEAGTLETIDGLQVGRLRLLTDDAQALSGALRAAGIHVEEAA
ncbi:ATP-binding cassette domain-containing protein [Brevibacterium sp. 5221]|uniref:ATP-binding cassette domain-containing protein n=1 Tax=Brevibacterium rongguiense TaxID=2695267 RepID=A0A6N9H4V1_9MICO|nr:ATP-binding cassette domain-containing protein [Brevibacterium rongguiense]MYM19050.1 ATP-binding cassette domain-containing protein [Brevibacterium rongguiense]